MNSRHDGAAPDGTGPPNTAPDRTSPRDIGAGGTRYGSTRYGSTSPDSAASDNTLPLAPGRRTVQVVVPVDGGDPDRPSGGHVYNGRVCAGLAAAGWRAVQHPVRGSWPWPDRAAEQCLADELAALEDGAVVLIDGLIASAAAYVVVPAARRLAVVVLVHMPLGEQFPGHHVDDAGRRESAVLSAARAVITTSEWTRARLLARYPLAADIIHVCRPGVDHAEPAMRTATGSELLCVATVAPHKGQDAVLAALASLTDRAWRCRFVGPLDRDPEFVARLREKARVTGMADRIDFTGPLTGEALDRAYAEADLLLLASHAETYGMVITEALARGLPVIATEVGGIPEALGSAPSGRPGLLVPPGDPAALSAAVRLWLDDANTRRRLRVAARERRPLLAGWDRTCAQVAVALDAAEADATLCRLAECLPDSGSDPGSGPVVGHSAVAAPGSRRDQVASAVAGRGTECLPAKEFEPTAGFPKAHDQAPSSKAGPDPSGRVGPVSTPVPKTRTGSDPRVSSLIGSGSTSSPSIRTSRS